MFRVSNKNLLCTFTFNKGVGGHYFSMLSLLSIPVFENANLLEIGYQKSPILSSINSYKFIDFSFFSLFSVKKELKNVLKNYDSLNIFCFDLYSYSIIRMLLSESTKEIKITLIKCGGPNPSFYYPNTDNLICFSKENFDYFQKKTPNTLVSLIQNRVSRRELIASQVNDNILKNIMGVKIVCIARIGQEYKEKFLLANDLKDSILSAGEKCTLICIGSIDDRTVFEQLKHLLEVNVLWLTDCKYTNNASSYLNLMDIVIGTGRGAVESIFLDKVTFVPVNNSTQLVEVSSLNIDQLIENNFSGRTRLSVNNEIASSTLPLVKPSKSLVEYVISLYSIESGSSKYLEHIQQSKKNSMTTLTHRVRFVSYFVYSVFRERNKFFLHIIYPLLKLLNKIVRMSSK